MEDCTSLFSIFRQRQSCLATSNCTRSSHLPTEKSSLIETVTVDVKRRKFKVHHFRRNSQFYNWE
ncbi:hypothetical protein T07_13794 [Trichinella nelsoni]|uniref:Uncharacterized protein n=1 Tax=Trichinella nelsoni TaxID=6336 RepID=A0A0V0S4Y8_9BILA|nr:hypothetical protein T07_13794 [Trichinella nelsoni]